MSEGSVTLVAAIIAALSGLSAAGISAVGNRSIQDMQRRMTQRQESTEFLENKLQRLYMPVTTHLSVTKRLFDRYFEANTTDQEKIAIEHALKQHNQKILEILLGETIYLERDAPPAATTELPEHLVQWLTVYDLKYESRVYDGPVFAGIKRFGFRGFPPGVDEYFAGRSSALREELHRRFEEEQ